MAALRSRQPAQIVVAVPTASAATCARLDKEADEVVCLTTPEPFMAVGQAYEEFGQTTDREVRELLRQETTTAAGPAARSGRRRAP